MDSEEASDSDIEIYRIQKEEERYILKLFSILQFCYTQALQPIKTLDNYQDLQGYLQQIVDIKNKLQMKIQGFTKEDKRAELETQFHGMVEEYQTKHSIFKQIN